MVELRDDVEGIESAILMNPEVWVASGHVAGFTDPLVDCTGPCKKRWREDHLADERRARGKPPDAPGCPECGGALTAARQFNLMFKTFIGPVEEDAAQIWLRPETAQGMFVNFANVVNSTRRRLPFGIAQQGKGFRNEISPGNFVFRLREFELMEMEYFCKPGTRPRVARVLVRGTASLARRRHGGAQGESSPAPACERGAVPLQHRDQRHRVPLPLRVGRARRGRRSHRLRPQDAHGAQRARSLVLRHRDQRALRAVRHRAGGQHRPHLHHAARRRVRRGGGARREARGAAPASRRRPGAGRGAAALQEGRAHRAGATHRARPAPALRDHVRRDPGDRPPLPPAGRDRHAAGGHLRLRLAERPRGDHPRTRRDDAGARAHRRAARRAARSARRAGAHEHASGRTADTARSIPAW